MTWQEAASLVILFLVLIPGLVWFYVRVGTRAYFKTFLEFIKEHKSQFRKEG